MESKSNNDDRDGDDVDKPKRFSTSVFGVVGSDSEREASTPPAS